MHTNLDILISTIPLIFIFLMPLGYCFLLERLSFILDGEKTFNELIRYWFILILKYSVLIIVIIIVVYHHIIYLST